MTHRSLLSTLVLLGLACCNPTPEPLSPDPAPAKPPAPPRAGPSGPASASGVAAMQDASVPDAAAEALAPEAAPPAEPALFGADGGILPQTEDRPSTDTPLFEHHVSLLFDAIVNDDPELARAFFFPLSAYEQVKAIAKPGRDWEARLWKSFVRDVHAYHALLGDDPGAAKLARIEVRESGVRWMKPHSEGNRIGYFRVTRSKLHLRKADGAPLQLEVTSMISWRGAWYVVHLNGFR